MAFKLKIWCIALLLTFAAPMSLVWAQWQQEDRDAPMEIEADTLTHDQIRGITIATGNVVVTQGNMLLKAEKVELEQDVLGYQNVTATGSATTLAYLYQQGRPKRQVNRPVADVEALGERIVYNGDLDELQLIESAILRRILDGKLQDEVKGKRIVYNNIVDTYCVESRAGQCPNQAAIESPSGHTKKTSDRVRVIIGAES